MLIQARVEDLTEYTEILKGEIESLRKKDKSKKVGTIFIITFGRVACVGLILHPK